MRLARTTPTVRQLHNVQHSLPWIRTFEELNVELSPVLEISASSSNLERSQLCHFRRSSIVRLAVDFGDLVGVERSVSQKSYIIKLGNRVRYSASYEILTNALQLLLELHLCGSIDAFQLDVVQKNPIVLIDGTLEMYAAIKRGYKVRPNLPHTPQKLHRLKRKLEREADGHRLCDEIMGLPHRNRVDNFAGIPHFSCPTTSLVRAAAILVRLWQHHNLADAIPDADVVLRGFGREWHVEALLYTIAITITSNGVSIDETSAQVDLEYEGPAEDRYYIYPTAYQSGTLSEFDLISRGWQSLPSSFWVLLQNGMKRLLDLGEDILIGSSTRGLKSGQADSDLVAILLVCPFASANLGVRQLDIFKGSRFVRHDSLMGDENSERQMDHENTGDVAHKWYLLPITQTDSNIRSLYLLGNYTT